MTEKHVCRRVGCPSTMIEREEGDGLWEHVPAGVYDHPARPPMHVTLPGPYPKVEFTEPVSIPPLPRRGRFDRDLQDMKLGWTMEVSFEGGEAHEALRQLIDDAAEQERLREEKVAAASLLVGFGYGKIDAMNGYATAYILHPGIPLGECFEFPSWDAFTAWERRND